MSAEDETQQHQSPPAADLAIVLTGGGARAAYQVGLLRCLARKMPDLRFPIITGVSAGAINAAFLASYQSGLGEAVDALCDLWSQLTVENVFRVNARSLGRSFMRWGARLASGGSAIAPDVRGLVDTSPLHKLLSRTLGTVDGEIPGIVRNLEHEDLQAVALTTLSYTTGQTVTWVQGCAIDTWEAPNRRSVKTKLSVDHVMASAALPLFFPAVRIGNAWHGDGGIRLAAPLSPAVHLGASRILAISTRYDRSQAEADRPTISGYPPPAQIIGHLMNAVFLDVLDQDLVRTDRLNRLLCKLPPEHRGTLRPVEVLVLRPSQDLGKLSAKYEAGLPRGFRFLTRGLGTRETESPDFLSLLMFQPDYMQRLIELGEADAEARVDDLVQLITSAERC
jgi:NTE family protein